MNKQKVSYAQSGEDIVIEFIFDTLQTPVNSYLDIGAHHATYLSNSYYFYKKGVVGVCVEPDPVLCEAIKQVRPNDICLQVGIGSGARKKAPFYIMDPPTLNTFSKKEAETYEQYYPWTKIVKETSIKLVSVNTILGKYFNKGLDILSVDTEGMDLEIIKNIDFNKYHPRVICVETATYTGKHSLSKNKELISYLLARDYFVYADTFVNTIFIERAFWKDHGGAELEDFHAYN